MGKSRLLMEFINEAEASQPTPQIMTTRGLAQTSRIPFYLWRTILRNRFGISEHEDGVTAARIFEDAIVKIWGGTPDGQEAAHLVGELIGLKWMDSPQLKNYDISQDRHTIAFYKMRDLLQRMSNNQPTIMLLDDLQWADKESLQLLSYIMEKDLKQLKLYILAAARPEFLRDHPSWRNSASILTLGPLPTSSETVMEAYPDLRVLPKQILVELAARSEGNPYFLEEIVKVLIKPGLEDFRKNPAEAMARLQAQIPESLRATLQARLDNLPRDVRTIALLAAVVGRVFWVGAVLAAARANTGTGTLTNMPDPVIERLVQDGLRHLVRAEVAFPRAGSQYSPDQEYIFKNSFLRDVAYSLTPNRSRAIYHRSVALWLANHNEMTFRMMSAEHYESGRSFIEAAMQYDLAAQLARDRHAPLEAAMLENAAVRARSRAHDISSEIT
jgi:predicted ATPase